MFFIVVFWGEGGCGFCILYIHIYFIFFKIPLGNALSGNALSKKWRKSSQDFWGKRGTRFSPENVSSTFSLIHTHTKTMQKWPDSLKTEKKEALAQSYTFALLILPLNKTDSSITAWKVSFYTGISNFKPTALLFKIC